MMAGPTNHAPAMIAGPARRLTAAYKRQLRRTAELALERLLSLLDELDGDPDLEDGHDIEAVSEDEGAQCEDEGAPEFEECGTAPFSMNQLGNRWFSGESDPASGNPAPAVLLSLIQR